MEPARVSVTEVRNALRCPRVFTLGRLRRNAVAFPVGSSCLGGTFHRIVDKLAQTVEAPPDHFAALPKDAPREAVRDGLSRWLLGLLVAELESHAAYRTMPAEVDDLAEALRELAQYLSERVGAGAPAEELRGVLRAGERPVEAVIAEAGVLLNGRIDALYAGKDGRLDVIEYKLTDDENDPVDRAQVALYRELLRRSDALSARPVILRFNPALAVTELAEPRADALVRAELVPLLRNMSAWLEAPEAAPATRRRDLCAACPVAKDCAEQYPAPLPARDDPPMAASRPRPPPEGSPPASAAPIEPRAPSTDEEGMREAQAIQRRVLEELRKEGIPAESPPPTVGPTLYVIAVTRMRGSLRQLDQVAKDVEHRLAKDELDVKYSPDGPRRAFTVKRKPPRAVLLGPLLEQRRAWLAERSGRFVIGQAPDGRIVTGDLSDSATPHLLIGGQAGSGKSVLLKTLVASLVHFHSPSELRLTLLDPKRVTFNAADFQAAIATHLDGPLLYGIDDAMPCIERYIDVMEERYARFERERVSDLHEYNQVKPAERLPRHVIVVDEFGDLTADTKGSKAFCTAVGRLGAKARAAGVHLILATQRPDRQTVPPILKANLGGKIALRVATAVNSRVVLDEQGAESLLGKGDLLADLGQGITRAQAALVGGQ